MRKFLHDAVDLALLRNKPLDYYVYDWWVPIAWITIIGAVSTFIPIEFTVQLNTGVIQRTVFSILITWVGMIWAAVFFNWWVRLDKRCTQRGSLFPLLSLLQSLALLLFIAALLPPGLDVLVQALIVIYALVVQIRAISRATGTGIRHTIAGTLAFLPAKAILVLLSLQIAGGLGWVDLNKAQQDDKADVTAPAKNDNSTKPTKSGEGES
jgi:hypothetical protein